MINHRHLEHFKPDPIKVKHVLLQHQLKVITGANEEDMQPVHVRRKHIFEDAMRAFAKPSFNVSKMYRKCFKSGSFPNKHRMKVVPGGNFFVI